MDSYLDCGFKGRCVSDKTKLNKACLISPSVNIAVEPKRHFVFEVQ